MCKHMSILHMCKAYINMWHFIVVRKCWHQISFLWFCISGFIYPSVSLCIFHSIQICCDGHLQVMPSVSLSVDTLGIRQTQSLQPYLMAPIQQYTLGECVSGTLLGIENTTVSNLNLILMELYLRWSQIKLNE